MKAFRVYFEFYGRQMVTEVEARNEHEAKERVKERISFLKIKEVAQELESTRHVSMDGGNWNSVLDFLMGFKNRRNNV